MKQSKVGDELDAQSTVRASVSLPQGLHAELERIAREKKCHWRGLCGTRPKGMSPTSGHYYRNPNEVWTASLRLVARKSWGEYARAIPSRK